MATASGNGAYDGKEKISFQCTWTQFTYDNNNCQEAIELYILHRINKAILCEKNSDG